MTITNGSFIWTTKSYQTKMITKWALLPDIDITNMAHNNTNGLHAQFWHVKGHQNKKADQK
jgi:hypothetical protein